LLCVVKDSPLAFNTSSQRINELLADPNCTLQDLLDEESFLSEVQMGNMKLFKL